MLLEVCLDGSKPSAVGLRIVARWLEHCDCSCTALHVWDEKKLSFFPLRSAREHGAEGTDLDPAIKRLLIHIFVL